jgi:hypothetical protein
VTRASHGGVYVRLMAPRSAKNDLAAVMTDPADCIAGVD